MATSTEEKPENSTAGPTVTYQWMITLQWTDERGRTCSATRSGTAGVTPGASRNDVSAGIYANITETCEAPGAVVLFFSLEPDALAG